MELCEASALVRIRSLPAGALDGASASGAGSPMGVLLPCIMVMILVHRLSYIESLELVEAAR